MARFSKKRDSREIGGGGEHVALTGNQCPAECGIEKVFLRQLPGNNLANRRALLTPGTCQRVHMLPWYRRFRCRHSHRESGHDIAAILRLIRSSLGIEPGYEPVLDFMGIGEDVALVELDNIVEIVYAGHKSIYGARLDDVLPLPSQEFLVKHTLERGRAQFHGGIQGMALNRIVDCLAGILATRAHQPLRVIGFMQRQVWTQSPSSKQKWQGNLRIQVKSPEQIRSTESRRAGLNRIQGRTLLWLAARQNSP